MLPPPQLGSSKDHIGHPGTSVGLSGTAVSNVPILRQEEGLLSQVFFSRKNIDVIQNSLRYRVYRESGGQFVVGRQSDIELLSIMRDVYESSQRHVPDSQVLFAVQRLNEYVLQKAVPSVLSAVRFHDYYLRDINQPNPVPEDRPALMSNKGSKVLQPFSRL